jgi:hypothetical protein
MFADNRHKIRVLLNHNKGVQNDEECSFIFDSGGSYLLQFSLCPIRYRKGGNADHFLFFSQKSKCEVGFAVLEAVVYYVGGVNHFHKCKL